ncbi:unnamed protein product [Parajaminaea phylloscopi]
MDLWDRDRFFYPDAVALDADEDAPPAAGPSAPHTPRPIPPIETDADDATMTPPSHTPESGDDKLHGAWQREQLAPLIHAPSTSDPQGQIRPPPLRSRASKSAAKYDHVARDRSDEDEDEDAERVCRICRCPPEAGQPLYHPCKCTGSIRYCHQDCLKEWLTHSRKSRCELCSHPFTFNKVYQRDMPSRLPRLLRVAYVIRKFFSWAVFLARCALVSVVWLAFVPMAHITFLRAAFEAADLLIWVFNGANSTWSGVTRDSLNATQVAYSTSAPAAPSPLNVRLVPAGLTNASGALGAMLNASQKSSSILKSAVAGSTAAASGPDSNAAGLWRLVEVAALLEPTGLLSLCLGLVTGLTSRVSDDASGSTKNGRASRVISRMTNDIFRGQILTCGIVVLVLAAWFTREWVVMQLPAHIPDLAEEGPVGPVLEQQADTRAEAGHESATQDQQAHESPDESTEFLASSPTDADIHQMWDFSEIQNEWDRIVQHQSDGLTDRQTGPSANGDAADIDASRSPVEPFGSEQFGYDAQPARDQLRAARIVRYYLRNNLAGASPDSGLDGSVRWPDGGPQGGASSVTDDHAKLLSAHEHLPSQHPEGEQAYRVGQSFGDLGDHKERPVGAQGHASSSESGIFFSPITTSSASRSSEAETEMSNVQPNWPSYSDEPIDDDGDDVVGGVGGGGGDDDEDKDALLAALSEHERAAYRTMLDDEASWRRADRIAMQQLGLAPPDEPDASSNEPAAAPDEPAVPLDEPAVALAAAPENFDNVFGDVDDGGVDWDDNIEGEMEGLIEAIGFRGDPINLFANVSIVVALCFIFIILGLALPYFLGRTFGLGRGFVDICLAPVRLLRLVTDPAIDWTIESIASLLTKDASGAAQMADDAIHSSAMAAGVETSRSALSSRWEAAATFVPGMPQPDGIKHLFLSAARACLAGLQALPGLVMDRVIKPSELKLVNSSSGIADRAFCVALGHAWWMTLLALCLAVESSTQQHRRSPWWLRETVAQTILVIKVLFFLSIEILVFPLGCGVVIDISTLPILGGSLGDRYTSALATPLSWMFTRWAIGTLWMFRFGLYVRHVRNVLRPGVLSWIRDPEDPDFQPIKEILERGSLVQLRKIGASAVMYASIIVALFGINAWASWLLFPSSWNIYPLRNGPSLAPLDIVVILLVTPFVVEWSQWEAKAAQLSSRWWRMASYHTGLTRFFLANRAGLRASTSTQRARERDDERSFLARVAASDNAVVGSPLIIELDSKTGQPVTDRGTEALREQLQKIEKMQSPKAKYTNLRLPRHFGRRIIAALTMLWASISLGLFSLLIPLVVGRRLTSDRQMDGYAFCVGCVALCPLYWCLAAVLRTRRVQEYLASPAWGGHSSKLHLRRSRHVDAATASKWLHWLQSSFKSTRKRVRRLSTALWLILALGFITPTLLGIAVDQVLVSHLRFAVDDVAQTSLGYAWAMGVLEQELLLLLLPYLPEQRLQVAVRELRRRGYKRAKAWRTTRDLVLPMAAGCTAVIVAPLMISSLLERVLLRRGEDRGEGSMETLTSAARLAVLVGLLVAALTELVLARMGQYDRELRDELYLQASELLNYEVSTAASGSRTGTGKTAQKASVVEEVASPSQTFEQMDLATAESTAEALLRALELEQEKRDRGVTT